MLIFDRNPLFEKWFGEKTNEEPKIDSNVETTLLNVFSGLQTGFENLINNPIKIDLDLKNPYPNPRICLTVKTPKTATLGQIINFEYTFEFLEAGSGFFVVHLDSEEESPMLIFLGKTINLIEFNDNVRSVKITLEALVHHTGVYRVPDMVITDFKGNFLKQLFSSFVEANLN